MKIKSGQLWSPLADAETAARFVALTDGRERAGSAINVRNPEARNTFALQALAEGIAGAFDLPTQSHATSTGAARLGSLRASLADRQEHHAEHVPSSDARSRREIARGVARCEAATR
jgi:hypothetical protein